MDNNSQEKKRIENIKFKYMCQLRRDHKVKFPPGRASRALYLKKYEKMMLPSIVLRKVQNEEERKESTKSEKLPSSQMKLLSTHDSCSSQKENRQKSPVRLNNSPPHISLHIKSAIPVKSHVPSESKLSGLRQINVKEERGSTRNILDIHHTTSGTDGYMNGVESHTVKDCLNDTNNMHRSLPVFGIAKCKKSSKDKVPSLKEKYHKRSPPKARKPKAANSTYTKIYKFLKSTSHKHLQARMVSPSKQKSLMGSKIKSDISPSLSPGITKHLKLNPSLNCIERTPPHSMSPVKRPNEILKSSPKWNSKLTQMSPKGNVMEFSNYIASKSTEENPLICNPISPLCVLNDKEHRDKQVLAEDANVSAVSSKDTRSSPPSPVPGNVCPPVSLPELPSPDLKPLSALLNLNGSEGNVTSDNCDVIPHEKPAVDKVTPMRMSKNLNDKNDSSVTLIQQNVTCVNNFFDIKKLHSHSVTQQEDDKRKAESCTDKDSVKEQLLVIGDNTVSSTFEDIHDGWDGCLTKNIQGECAQEDHTDHLKSQIINHGLSPGNVSENKEVFEESSNNCQNDGLTCLERSTSDINNSVSKVDADPDSSVNTFEMKPESTRKTALEIAQEIINEHVHSPKSKMLPEGSILQHVTEKENATIEPSSLPKFNFKTSFAKALKVVRQRITDSNPDRFKDCEQGTDKDNDIKFVMNEILEQLVKEEDTIKSSDTCSVGNNVKVHTENVEAEVGGVICSILEEIEERSDIDEVTSFEHNTPCNTTKHDIDKLDLSSDLENSPENIPLCETKYSKVSKIHMDEEQSPAESQGANAPTDVSDISETDDKNNDNQGKSDLCEHDIKSENSFQSDNEAFNQKCVSDHQFPTNHDGKIANEHVDENPNDHCTQSGIKDRESPECNLSVPSDPDKVGEKASVNAFCFDVDTSKQTSSSDVIPYHSNFQETSSDVEWSFVEMEQHANNTESSSIPDVSEQKMLQNKCDRSPATDESDSDDRLQIVETPLDKCESCNTSRERNPDLQLCQGRHRTYFRRKPKRGKRRKHKLSMPKRRIVKNDDEKKVPKIRLVSTDTEQPKASDSSSPDGCSPKLFVVKPMNEKRKRKSTDLDVKKKSKIPRLDDNPTISNVSTNSQKEETTLSANGPRPKRTRKKKINFQEDVVPKKRRKRNSTENPQENKTTFTSDAKVSPLLDASETGINDDRLSREFSKHNWIIEKYRKLLDSAEESEGLSRQASIQDSKKSKKIKSRVVKKPKRKKKKLNVRNIFEQQSTIDNTNLSTVGPESNSGFQEIQEN